MPPSTSSKITTNHDEIRRWAEERKARPAAANAAIRLAFPGDDESLMEIPWDKWFENLSVASWRCSTRKKPPEASAAASMKLSPAKRRKKSKRLLEAKDAAPCIRSPSTAPLAVTL